MFKRWLIKTFLNDKEYQSEYVAETLDKCKKLEESIDKLKDRLALEIEYKVLNQMRLEEISSISNVNGNTKIYDLANACIEQNKSSIAASKQLLNKLGYKNIPNTDYTIRQVKIQ